jgi:hypothetical protein
MAKISAGVDHEPLDLGRSEHVRDDVDQMAFARRSHVDDQRPSRDQVGTMERRAPAPAR